MSHITILKTCIKNPNLELLKQAVADLAKELGGEMVTQVEDYYHNKTRVVAGFKTSSMTRGVGIDVVNGEVVVKGDFWNTNVEPQDITDRVNQLYVASATQIALRSVGYQVTQTKQQDRIVLKAMAW